MAGNGIAPRILMPKEMFIQAAENFREELSEIDNPYVLSGSVKKFVSLEENDSFLVRITI